MEPKFTIALINHSFQIGYFSRRWELFAQQHPNVEVYLLAPQRNEWYNSKGYSYDKAMNKIITADNFDNANFHRRVYRTEEKKYVGWTSPDFQMLLSQIKPNIVYHIGTHNMASLRQVLRLRNRLFPQIKVIAFSMRGPALNLKIKKDKCNLLKWIGRRLFYLYQKNQLKFINNNVDAFFCHYPDAVRCFRKEGFKGAIYMQTQVGVNEEWFHEDLHAREEIRKRYNISESTYVFGSATRFTSDKGIDIILKSLPIDGDWKYLMMGTGSDEDKERLRSIVAERNIGDKVIETGMVDWYDIAKYWNAVDCAIHVPLTTPHWEDTFALSAIQPQITKKPVIGDTSGSIPYQIGFEEMIVPEGDVDSLREKIIWVLSHKKEAKEYGALMYQRTHDSFEIKHLNDLFYDTLVEDILLSKYDVHKIDMVNYYKKK